MQCIKWHLTEWEVRGQDAAVLWPGLAQGWQCHSMGWGAWLGLGVGGWEGCREGGIVVSWGQVVPGHSTCGGFSTGQGQLRRSQTGEPGDAGAACPATGVDQKYGYTQAPRLQANAQLRTQTWALCTAPPPHPIAHLPGSATPLPPPFKSPPPAPLSPLA